MKEAGYKTVSGNQLDQGIKTRAYAAYAAGEPLRTFEIERRSLRPYDISIAIHFCGICHCDIHQTRDEWGGSLFPMVPGHEITGIVSEVGKAVRRFKPGDRVGVGCMIDSCRECNPCLDGFEQYCERGPTSTYNDLDRDGESTYGGYAGNIVVDENYVLRMPRNLPMDASAPLLCAGVTAYSALKQWKVGRGTNLAVMGLGGLGHLTVKMAKAMGAEVTILSHSLTKKFDSARLGADHFYCTRDTKTFRDSKTFALLKNRFNLIINTVSSKLDVNPYLDLLQFGGTMVLVGVPPERLEVDASQLIKQQRNIAGSNIGGIAETQEMLVFCSQHNIVPDIEIVEAEGINQAYDRVVKGEVRYRFVLDCQSLH